MSCLKGKSENKPKPGRFSCKKCGAVSKKKGHLCKPKKITEPGEDKTKEPPAKAPAAPSE